MTSRTTLPRILQSSSPLAAGLLLVGASGFGTSTAWAKPQGLTLSQIELNPLEPFEQLQSVERLDDLDGDGTPDYAVSIPRRYLEFGPGAGGYGVIEARSSRTGQVLWTLENTEIEIDLGHSMRAIGDVDGDGFRDLAVSRLEFDFLSFPAVNSIGFVSGMTGLMLYDTVYHPYQFNANLTIVSVGDVDGDGRDDWAVSEERAAPNQGSVHLHTGATGAEIARFTSPAHDYGTSLVLVDDMDGDGTEDIAVGSTGGGDGPIGVPRRGSVEIRSGRTLTLIREIEGTEIASGFGARLLTLDDMDGDGLRDLFVAPFSTFQGARGTVVSTATGAILTEFTAPLANIIDGLVLVSDRDGDGVRDFAVGDPFADINGVGATASVRVFCPVTGTEIERIEGAPGDEFFGHALTSAGDLDGDGDDELLYTVLEGGNDTSRAEIRQLQSPDRFWYCGGAPANSTGSPGRVDIAGSTSVAASSLRLLATDLPPMSFGFFIVSETPESSPATSGLGVRVCVGGAIGRLIGPGQVQATGTQGELNVPMDLSSIPSPTGSVPPPIMGSLYVQAWYRDRLPDFTLTSYVSDAYSFLVLP